MSPIRLNRPSGEDLLADAAAFLAGADPADAASIVPAVCVIGVAAELLAECAGTRDYRGRFYAAREPLDDAVSALRATPALRGAPVDVNWPEAPKTSSAAIPRRKSVRRLPPCAVRSPTRSAGFRPASGRRACPAPPGPLGGPHAGSAACTRPRPRRRPTTKVRQ
jgi:hypothetical protein